MVRLPYLLREFQSASPDPHLTKAPPIPQHTIQEAAGCCLETGLWIDRKISLTALLVGNKRDVPSLSHRVPAK